MPFDDHGISRSQCRCSVSAGHRESQGKVARAEDHDGAECMQHGAQIGPRSRFAAGIRPVDASHDPRTFFHHFREETKLAAGPRSFSLQAGLGQSALLLGALYERIHGAFNPGRDGAQELPSFTSGGLAVAGKSFMCQAGGQIYVVRFCGEEVRRQALAGAGIASAKRGPAVAACTGSDD